jgi:hypothetical protein
MRYLGLALYAEGATDYRLLSPLLRRLAEHCCLRGGSELIEVGEVQPLNEPASFRKSDRAPRILEAARDGGSALDVLFVHADGGGDPVQARRANVEPAARRIKAELSGASRCLAVVPVRESEAWALADGETLRRVLDTTLDVAALGLPPTPRTVESLPDPKAVLRAAHAAVVGKRGKRKVETWFAAIGQQARLDVLRHIPAFARLEADLQAALAELGYVKRPQP